MRLPLLALCAGLVLTATVRAADLAVLPVGLSLSAELPRGAIRVTNQGKEEVAIQVDAVAWSQESGRDVYVPSDDLLVNPPVFSIKPGRAQVLRVGLRQPPSGERELAYRLILREVPPPPAREADAGAGQVRVLLQMRLPVYVAPAQPLEGQQWQGQWTPSGALDLTLTNTGNIHMVVGELRLRVAEAATESAPLATAKAGSSVFPGQSRTWRLNPPAATLGQRYALEVTTDRGPRNVALDPVRP